MPFTLSHPAAVLALRRCGLPMTGLVIGSMVPDVPLFAPWLWSYSFSHSLVGIVTVDLVAGIVLTAAWLLLVRDAVVDAAPGWVRRRTTAAGRYGVRDWALVAPALVLGSLTHLVWDAFTHVDRWGTRHVSWLAEDHLGLAGYHWAQAVSTVVGFAVVVVYALRELARRNPNQQPARIPTFARWFFSAVIVVGAVAGAIPAAANLGDGLHAAAFAGTVHAIPAAAVAVVLASLVWRTLVTRA